MLTPSDVVLLEGVNAIGAIRDLVDLGIYLEAAEADLERWYVTRFLELVQEGRQDPTSFYASMAALSDDDVERLAAQRGWGSTSSTCATTSRPHERSPTSSWSRARTTRSSRCASMRTRPPITTPGSELVLL